MQEITYIEKGNKENCLFLIHGFCSGSEDWINQINFFSQHFTVIAPTLRGHDGKNINSRPMSIEQLSNDCVENYLKALHTPILLLHSTKIDKQNGRVPVKNSDDIPYINFIKLWSENTRLKIFEETGHYITIEEPEIVNKQITEWLESLKIHLR